MTKQHTSHTQICSVSWNYLWSINDNGWSNIAAKYLTLSTSIVRLFQQTNREERHLTEPDVTEVNLVVKGVCFCVCTFLLLLLLT